MSREDSHSASPSTPSGSGEPPVDEFAGITSRRPRSVVLAVVAAALAVGLVIRVRADLAYALSSSMPIGLGDARSLASRPIDSLPLNRYVKISGLPDRESAVILETVGGWTFSQFFRLLGTGSRAFVRRADEPVPVERALRDEFAGRLVRMDALPLNDSIRTHFVRHVSSTHFFRVADVVSAVGRGRSSITLTDTTGESVALEADDVLTIDVIRPNEYRFDLPADRWKTLADAQAMLKSVGAEVLSGTPGQGDEALHEVTVRFQNATARDAAFAAVDARDRRGRVRPARTPNRVKLSLLSSSPAALSWNGNATPIAQIAAVRTVAPVKIPDDALVLLEGERPASHLKTIVLAIVFLAFAVINLLALRRV